MKKSILITGCSSGIGYYTAHGLHARGYRVFATARRQELTTTAAGENRWDLTTAIPILPEVKEGDTFTVAVVARTISAQTDDGKAVIYARMQSATPPYEGFGDKSFKIGDRWQMVNLPFTATRGFGAGDATVTLHFAGAVQNLEIGPVYIFKTN